MNRKQDRFFFNPSPLEKLKLQYNRKKSIELLLLFTFLQKIWKLEKFIFNRSPISYVSWFMNMSLQQKCVDWVFNRTVQA